MYIKFNKGDYIMSYQEKRTIFTVVSGIVLLVAYGLYAYGKVQSGNIDVEDLKFWATTMLLFIGIGIVVTIIGQIIFHILIAISIAVKEKVHNNDTSDEQIEKTINSEMVTDEMDKLIELKSMRIGFIFAGVGFVLGLILLVLDYSPVIMLNILYVSFSVGSLLEGFAQIYYYRKGIQ
jgi:H+/Cl- antiporter ClcA